MPLCTRSITPSQTLAITMFLSLVLLIPECHINGILPCIVALLVVYSFYFWVFHCSDSMVIYPLARWGTAQAVCSSWLLWTKPLWPFTYLFPFLLGKCLRVRLLGHMRSMYFKLYNKVPNCYPKWLYHFGFLSKIQENSQVVILLCGLNLHFLND